MIILIVPIMLIVVAVTMLMMMMMNNDHDYLTFDKFANRDKHQQHSRRLKEDMLRDGLSITCNHQ